MIPKIIHYCWFGGNPIPKKDLAYIESWKKYCPDFKIIRWDESNYNVTKNQYMKEAYEAKKWAFVSDYARLDIIYQYGGFYFDTDVEIIKNLDSLVNLDGFLGLETTGLVNPGLCIGAEPNHPTIKKLIDEIYSKSSFIESDGTYNLLSIPKRVTPILCDMGLILNNKKQVVGNMTIFPTDYFCPMDFYSKEITITNNTISIHHYEGSWLSDEQRDIFDLRKKINKVLPRLISHRMAVVICYIKHRGFIKGIKDLYYRHKDNNKD